MTSQFNDDSSHETGEQGEECVFCAGPATAWIVTQDFDAFDLLPAACDRCCGGLNEVMWLLPLNTEGWVYIDLDQRFHPFSQEERRELQR